MKLKNHSNQTDLSKPQPLVSGWSKWLVSLAVLQFALNMSTVCARQIFRLGSHQRWRTKPKNGLRRHPSLLSCSFRGGSSFAHSIASTDLEEVPRSHRVFLAVGSNLGDRFHNIQSALKLLERETESRLIRSSFLHQTAPMYVTNQPAFMNGAVCLETDLEPSRLLDKLKEIESRLGRDLNNGIRNGPRPVDLDILFYQKRDEHGWSDIVLEERADTEKRELIIPHPRIQERDFVLIPMLDIVGGSFKHPTLNTTLGCLLEDCISLAGSESGGFDPPVRVLPLPRGRSLLFNETLIMGILNVTPDSFSDGGKWSSSVNKAAEHAIEMSGQGAGIIDVGGESTRPGAEEVLAQEEIQRTIPVIEEIRKKSDVPISIDTRRAVVARAAVEAGADIVNDVSGGTFDPEMLSTVAELQVPMVLMHMRGTPKTMQSMTDYRDIVTEVGEALRLQSVAAEKVGVHRWLQVVDPGIGFAKDFEGNLKLLRHLDRIRSEVEDLPILLGTSRKGFIGKITGVDAADRDFGSVSSCVATLCLESSKTTRQQTCTILRVHNVDAFVQAAKVMDAVQKSG